jgi:hypothetical protein
MRKASPSALRHLVTSLKVVAVVTVLGTVVMAAERHLATRISPEEIIATDMAPAQMSTPAGTPASAGTPEAAAPAQQPSTDYFPSHFPEPKGEAADQAPTF